MSPSVECNQRDLTVNLDQVYDDVIGGVDDRGSTASAAGDQIVVSVGLYSIRRLRRFLGP